jgi:glycerol-1-phosphate dehydrogenase [NAD(P)+]
LDLHLSTATGCHHDLRTAILGRQALAIRLPGRRPAAHRPPPSFHHGVVTDGTTLARAMRPDLHVGRVILADRVASLRLPYVLVTQPQPLALLDPTIAAGATAIVEATSLDVAVLQDLERALPAASGIVGVGGGVTMDTAKYLAWQSGMPLLLAPSIVSVDAAVTNTVAVRRAGTVVYDGFVVADAIVADLDLIAQAPRRLNRAGVGDLLSIQTARIDWARGAQAGRISFDPGVDAAARQELAALLALADQVAAVTDAALEHIVRAYVRVNALCLGVGHSGPEEGSEHYFAYAAEAATGRSFVHGEIVGLGVVLMASLQGAGSAEAAAFLDGCAVAWRPEELGLDARQLAEILQDLPGFVRRAGLPWSIIDEATFDEPTIAALLASVDRTAD